MLTIAYISVTEKEAKLATLATNLALTFLSYIWHEVPQLLHYKCRAYFSILDNWTDLSQLLMTVVVTALQIANVMNYDVSLNVLQRWFTVILLLLNVIKWCYFGRCIDVLQNPLYMIHRVFIEMSPFLALLMFFSTIFTFMNITSNVDVPGGDDHHETEDFPYRSDFEKHFMQGLLNSFGDISLSEFGEWKKLYKKFPVSSSSMVVLGLTINFSQIIFMVIVNLNLLIAIISEVFDKVRSSQEVTRYQEMTQMILESAIHQAHRLFRGAATPVGIVSILSKKGEDENNEFMGLTNRVKYLVFKSESNIKSEMKTEVAGVKSEIKAVETRLKIDIDAIKADNAEILALLKAKK